MGTNKEQDRWPIGKTKNGSAYRNNLLALAHSTMNNRQTLALLKQQFWTSFGRNMAPVTSADGLKINWINYKTSVKNLQFSMQAGSAAASISIELTHKDADRQVLLYNRLLQVKNVLRHALQEEWQWALQVVDEHGKMISGVDTSLEGVSIYKQDHWPRIISFLKRQAICFEDLHDGC
ncbi:MAG: DUF4268 domain-containing protein [Bacteroidota bacterium]